jgi:glutamyl-tRNA synthetase
MHENPLVRGIHRIVQMGSWDYSDHMSYRGRIAPSPTGYLHVGHAITFWQAQERARSHGGALVLRMEDLDPERCRIEFASAALEDFTWFGLRWVEGPDVGGPFGPYIQSSRRSLYLEAWRSLRDAGLVYPCRCSRKDVMQSAVAPHDENEEPIYPGTCRPDQSQRDNASSMPTDPAGIHWRFRVPDGEKLQFNDERLGTQEAVAGTDFGDFVVWRKDDVPAYQLAVVVDDSVMNITEVVRGEDLLMSTFRQLLLYRALNSPGPAFYHTPLVRDQTGNRLAKRHASLSLRALREAGVTPDQIRQQYL